MAVTRHDFQSGEDRAGFVPGIGFMYGFPTRSGTSNATTGVPTNGVAGFAPGAIFQNWKGAVGSALYVNVGTVSSATWVNIA
jgi:hypothetical protein